MLRAQILLAALLCSIVGTTSAGLITINQTVDISGFNGNPLPLGTSITPLVGDSIDATINFADGASLRNERTSLTGSDFITFDFLALSGGSFTINNIVVTLFGLQTNAGITSPLTAATNSSGTAHIGPIFFNLLPNVGDFLSYTGYRVMYDIAAWGNPVTLDSIWLRDGSGITTSSIASSIPIPATLALFGIGLAGLGWSGRKKV